MKVITDLPLIFDTFADARKQGFIAVKELKEQGTPVIGGYCTFLPEELAIAAGAIQISLCSTSDETIPDAEEDLPRNLCPLIKSSYGFGKTDKCPYFYFSDLVVGETTCDGKKKMYEYMEDFKPTYVMQLPNKIDTPASLALWKDEIIRYKDKLEAFLQVEITEEKIHEAILLKNRERQARKAFYGLGKLNPPALTGTDIFKVMYGANFTMDKEKLIADLNDMTEKVLIDYENGKVLERKPRILVTGCPIGGVTEKVIRAIEDNGAIAVAFENCTVAKPVERLVDEDKDVYDALTEKYINIGCACINHNNNRVELLDEMIEEYQVDGVLDMVLQACIPFAVESNKIRRFCMEDKEIPYLYLETDYSSSDIEQINTRVTAFIEMLEG